MLKVGWLLSCLACHLVQTRIILSAIRNKAPGMQSLNDLLNHDLCAISAANCAAFIAMEIATTLGVKVAHASASILCGAFETSVLAIYAYMTLTAAVKFLHIRSKSVELCISYSHQQVRYFTLASVMAVTTCSVLIKQHLGILNPYMSAMTKNDSIKSEQDLLIHSYILLGVVAINVAVRIFVLIEKRRNFADKKIPPSYFFLPMMICLVSALLVSSFWIGQDAVEVGKMAAITFFSACLPFLIICTDKTSRRHFIGCLTQLLDVESASGVKKNSWWSRRGTAVSPQLKTLTQ